MGTKGKKPAMLFYPRDWLADPGLNVCSLCAQGLWMRMLCYMWESKDRGFLRVNGKALDKGQICRLVGAGNSLHEVRQWLGELEDAGVYSVTDEGVIYSRRLVEDQSLITNKGAKKNNQSPRVRTRVEDENIYTGKAYARKADVSRVLRENKVTYDNYPGFVKFWDEYPPRNGVRANKQEAAVSWIWLNLESASAKILKSVMALKETDQWKKDGGTYVPMAVTFLNNRRWEDEVEEFTPSAWTPEVEQTA